MNDTRFTQALNIVLVLDQSGCLKQDADHDDPKNEQKPVKKCSKQIKALLIIHDFLCQLYPETSEDDLKQELHPNNRCPHCRDHDIN